MWTKASGPPPSWAMKPKPFWALNHFTVPDGMMLEPRRVESLLADQGGAVHHVRSQRPQTLKSVCYRLALPFRLSSGADWRLRISGGSGLSRLSDDVDSEIGPGPAPRYSRRLSDKILIAFHHACDQNYLQVAEQLLQVLEMMLARRPLIPSGTRRRNTESLVAAHERLWQLRHPDSADETGN
jgi:hypothetical protein